MTAWDPEKKEKCAISARRFGNNRKPLHAYMIIMEAAERVGTVSIDPAALVHAVADVALDAAGALAHAMLLRLGIFSGMSVAGIVYDLVTTGAFAVRPEDTPDAFDVASCALCESCLNGRALAGLAAAPL